MIVPETEDDCFDDDDLTQADSPPAKRPCSASKITSEQCSPTWSEGADVPTTQDKATNTNLEISEGSTQTNVLDDIDKLNKANEAFGAFVGQELNNVPLMKRRYIMYQIIRMIENNS